MGRCRLGRTGVLYGSTRHLKIGSARQDFLHRLRVHLHAVIGKEELFAGEVRLVRLPAQVRSVLVEQRMEHRGGRQAGCRRIRIYPVALSGERVTRQADTLRRCCTIKLVPVKLQAFDPQLRNLA